jgi:Restriction endonuclease
MKTRTKDSQQTRETIASLLEEFRNSNDLVEQDAIADRLANHPSSRALLASFDAMADATNPLSIRSGEILLKKILVRASDEATGEHGALVTRLLDRKGTPSALRGSLLNALLRAPSHYWFDALLPFIRITSNPMEQRVLAVQALGASEPMQNDVDRVLELLDSEAAEIVEATLRALLRWQALSDTYNWESLVDRVLDLIPHPSPAVRVAAIDLLAEVGEIDHVERLLLYPKSFTGEATTRDAIHRFVETMTHRDVSILRITPRSFEWLVRQYLRTRGFTVTQSWEGRDGGIDLQATCKTADGHDAEAIVQCKRYRNRRVGDDVVNAMIEKMHGTGAQYGFVFTTSGFTEAAALRGSVYGRAHPDRLALVDRGILMSQLDAIWSERFNTRHQPTRP